MLGRRLGEMHTALSTPCDDPDFAPQSATEDDVKAWAAQARAQLEAAFDILRAKSDWNNEDEARRIARLVEQRERLLQAVDALAMQGVGTPLLRIHSDLHLGQVLVAHGDVYFVDFEGEPAKPLDVRRQKNSPLRDVAGLIRSYDYVAAFGGRTIQAGMGEAAELRKQQTLQAFAPSSQKIFLEAYRLAAHRGGGSSYSAEAEDALLRLFTLEKAAYEVCYEAANRPDWVCVPANGMAKLADGLLGASQGEGA
jgi:maltose alpha-D-glucosyltransferase/alpha-amylase